MYIIFVIQLQRNTKIMKTTNVNTKANKHIHKVVGVMQHFVDMMYSKECTFWACNNRPENNRIENMVTCSRCQSIINTNREIKKLQKLLLNS